jgi:hypothetical protein
MSALGAGPPPGQAEPPVRRGERWGRGPLLATGCHSGHGASGFVDESVRRLRHEELAVATLLAAEGHSVSSIAERRGVGPVADLSVCGTGVEVKSWQSLADRGGRPPDHRSVLNKLLKARSQAARVVLYARGSGLRPSEARRGMDLYARKAVELYPGDTGGPRRPRLCAVRVVGDGFDLSWSRRPSLRVEPDADRGSRRGSPRLLRPDPERRRLPGLGL